MESKEEGNPVHLLGTVVEITERKRAEEQRNKLQDQLLRRTIPKMIGIELNLQEGLKVINGDPAHIGQLMMNLSINARDAMPDGGKLLIKTQNSLWIRNTVRRIYGLCRTNMFF